MHSIRSVTCLNEGSRRMARYANDRICPAERPGDPAAHPVAIVDVRVDEGQVTLTVASESALPDLNRYLVAQNVDVYGLTPQKLSLEDLFIQIVGTDGGL